MEEPTQIDDSVSYVDFKDIAPEYKDERVSEILLQATVLLEDAKYFRSIYHKLDKKALLVYRFYYSKFIQRLLNINIFVILMLAFLERPSSLSWSSDIKFPAYLTKKFEFPCTLLETIDLCCLVIFIVDAIVKSYLVGRKEIKSNPWLITYYIVVIVSFCDCFYSIAEGCHSPFRIRRFFRPFFLIQSSSLMKKAIKALHKTIPEIISVFVLLLINLYFFALLGMLIYPRYYRIDDAMKNATNTYIFATDTNKTVVFEKNKVFGSLGATINNLLILVTTSNNPDVMEQAYARNRLSAFYFITYLLFGYYGITSLITAVIYNKFKGFFRDSIISSAFRQSTGIRASFWMLHSKYQIPENPGFLPKKVVESVIFSISISKRRRKALIKNLKNISYCISISPDIASYIELEQYEKLFFENFNGLDKSFEDSQIENITARLSFEDVFNANFFQKIRFKIRRYLSAAFETRAYLLFNSFVTIINIACISIELEVLKNPYHEIDALHRNLSYVILSFAIYYTLENSVKIWAFGWAYYRASFLNIADGVISLIFLILQLVHIVEFGHPYIINNEEFYITDDKFSLWASSRMFNVFLIFRLINLAPSVKVMYNIISTIVDMVRKLRPIFGILVFIYYDYALLGMELFGDTIEADTFDIDYNISDPDSYCGSFEQLNYYSHNFNDFYSSLVVLWTIMVINNWQVLIDAFALATKNEFSRLYFIFWWILCTLICLNMCVSLILDLYVLKCEAEEKQREENINKNIKNRPTLITSIHTLFNDTIPKPDDEQLREAILKHSYVDFHKIMINIEYNQELTTIQ